MPEEGKLEATQENVLQVLAASGRWVETSSGLHISADDLIEELQEHFTSPHDAGQLATAMGYIFQRHSISRRSQGFYAGTGYIAGAQGRLFLNALTDRLAQTEEYGEVYGRPVSIEDFETVAALPIWQVRQGSTGPE